MEIQIKQRNKWIFNIYLAPISDKGWIAAWPGQHSLYQKGFVLRVLWIGIVVRWAYAPIKRKKVYVDYENVGLYGDPVLAFLEEEPH